jgi:hypothetical protein
MVKITPDNALKLAILAAAAFGVYYVASRGVKGAAIAATGVATDVAAGLVIGAGKAFGIPETEARACAQALYEGRTWDASFVCPAGTFAKSFFEARPPDPGLSGANYMRRRRG